MPNRDDTPRQLGLEASEVKPSTMRNPTTGERASAMRTVYRQVLQIERALRQMAEQATYADFPADSLRGPIGETLDSLQQDAARLVRALEEGMAQ